MRKPIYWMLLLLTLVCSLGAMAVNYQGGSDINLSVRASDGPKIACGQAVMISINASDTDDVVARDGTITDRVNDPVTLSWQATGGRLVSTPAGGNQGTVLTWTAPTQPGYYAIFINADDSGRYADEPANRKIIEFTVQMAGTQIVPVLRVGANPQTIQLDKGSSTLITAQLFGKDVAGKVVTFFTTGGTLSAATATSNANGSAAVQLTVNRSNVGSIEVAAFFGNTVSTTTVQVSNRAPSPRQPSQPNYQGPPLPNYAPDFMIRVSPSTLPADGRSSADVSIQITDARGVGVIGRDVIFSIIGGGSIVRRSLTGQNGIATVRLTSADQPGESLILASVGTLRSYARVRFTPLEQQQATGVPQLYLTVTPTSVAADGASKLLMQVMALDSNGFALANVPIDFSTTLGTVQYPRVMTLADGRAGTYVAAPLTPGIATVTARLGQYAAASQVVFQGTVPESPSLDIRNWTGQRSALVAEGWLYRQVQVANDQQGGVTRTLAMVDGEGKVVKQFDLGATSMLVLDQYGTSHGYATEQSDKANIQLLKPDGTPVRTITLALPVGAHLQDVQYAEPTGNLLVTVANPDGTRPEVHFYSSTGSEILNVRDGLESMPLCELNSEGYLALAYAGGTVRVYSPQGALVFEARRTDGLPATQLAIGPGGTWVAVASALAGQSEIRPRLQIFARQGATGTPLASLDLEAVQLATAGKDGLVVCTPDSTQYLNLTTRTMIWSMPGGYVRFLENNGMGVIAGQRDPRTKAFIPRITVVRLNDGTALGKQDLTDVNEIVGITPPDANKQVGIVTTNYVIHFTMPTGM